MTSNALTRATFSELRAAASLLFDTSEADIMLKSRFPQHVRARQALMSALRLRGKSFPEIGILMKRDHSTCHSGHAEAQSLCARDPVFAGAVARLVSLPAGGVPALRAEVGDRAAASCTPDVAVVSPTYSNARRQPEHAPDRIADWLNEALAPLCRHVRVSWDGSPPTPSLPDVFSVASFGAQVPLIVIDRPDGLLQIVEKQGRKRTVLAEEYHLSTAAKALLREVAALPEEV